jgi:hypothetical protein
MRAQVCDAPAAIWIAGPVSPTTGVGVKTLLVVVPIPTCPKLLSPQQSTPPSAISAHV